MLHSTTARRCAPWIGGWLLTTIGAASAADLSPELTRVIGAQKAGLDNIESAHVVAELRVDSGDGTLRLTQQMEWWRRGDRERVANVAYGSMDGTTEVWRQWDPPLRTEVGYQQDTLHSLDNWNSDHTAEEPLVPGGPNSEAYAKTSAAIMPRDPAAPSPALFFHLLLMPFLTHDLQEMADAATEVRLVSESSEEVVIELLGAPFVERRVIALAPDRGYAMKRLTLYVNADDPEPVRDFEVVEFHDAGEGVHFPTHVVGRAGGAVVTDVKTLEVRINEPIDPESATVRFPQGARVDDLVTGQLHVWGKYEPELTFASLQDFREWEASTAQNLADERQAGGIFDSLWPYLVANGVILGFITVIVYVRRRLRPSRKQAS